MHLGRYYYAQGYCFCVGVVEALKNWGHMHLRAPSGAKKGAMEAGKGHFTYKFVKSGGHVPPCAPRFLRPCLYLLYEEGILSGQWHMLLVHVEKLDVNELITTLMRYSESQRKRTFI